MIWIAAVLALLGAAANAMSSVLQRKAARRSPDDESLSLRLVLHQLRRPAWFGGMGAMIAGFLLQATALAFGGLLVTQPVLAFELPLTLFIGSKLLGSRLSRDVWAAAVAMAVGLAMLLLFAAPTAGDPELPPLGWVIGIASTVGPVAVITVVARLVQGPLRAALFGIAAGAMFGLTAAIMDAVTKAFGGGLVQGLTAWQTYAMVASGIAATYLLQNAFQAGLLAAAQPGVTITDPLVAAVWGLFLFHASAQHGLRLIGAAAGALLLLAGIVLLVRSPALQAGQGADDSTGKRRGDPTDESAGDSQAAAAGSGRRR